MLKYRLIILLVGFLLLSPFVSSGQQLAMLHYSADDGLPSNTVYEIYRDSKGFLWFCTDKGVARYNGVRFEKFTTADGLADNEILSAREDGYGRLWFDTYNGKLCFYEGGIFHTESNTTYLRTPDNPPLINNILKQKDSSVIVCFAYSGYFINVGKHSSRLLLPKTPLAKELKYAVKISDNRYELYVANDALSDKNNFLITIDSTGRTIDTKPINKFWTTLVNPYQYYVSNYDSIFVLKEKSQFIPVTPNWRHLENIYCFFKNDIDNTLFIATPTESWINDTVPLHTKSRVTSFMSDMAGNYWVSTLKNGALQLSKNIFSTKEFKNVYKDKVLFAFAKDGNIIYVEQNGNIFKLSSNKTTCLYKNGPKDVPVGFYRRMPFIVDDDFNYYNFGDSTFISVLNPMSGRPVVSNVKTEFKLYKGGIFFRNNIYLWTGGLIAKFNKKISGHDKFIGIQYEDAIREKVFDLVKDGNKSLWYATLDNLYQIENDSSIIQPQFHNIHIKNFIICKDKLIGCTHNNMLLVCSNFRSTKMHIDTIKEQNCIWDNLYLVDSGHVLISTNNLYRLLTISTSTPHIQVVENPFIPTQSDYICNDKDLWYFFKNGSLFQLNKKDFFNVPQPPKVLITELSTRKHHYTFPANNSDIEISQAEASKTSIHFTSLSFSGGGNITYQYSLSENDIDFWQTSTTGEINLLAISYGDYKLKVRAKTLSSDYGNTIVLNIHVLRPFWAKYWFIGCCILLFAFIIIVIIHYVARIRLYLEKRKHNNELRFLKLEYKAMNALMNPHFIFNSLNNIQGLINRDDKLAANKYLTYFSTLVRQNMHNINEDLIPLQKEINLIQNYLKLEQLRFDNRFEYSIIIGPEVNTLAIMIAPLLVQPLVENAILHGLLPRKSICENFVWIHIYRNKEDYVCIEIKDNGIGLNNHKPAGKVHQSFGIQNIRERIQKLASIHHQHIIFSLKEYKDDNNNTAGTIALICIRH